MKRPWSHYGHYLGEVFNLDLHLVNQVTWLCSKKIFKLSEDISKPCFVASLDLKNYVCLFTFYRASEAVLRHIHSVGMRLTPSSLPVDSFVYNLLYEVPLPSPSRSTRLFAGKQNIICYRPGTRQAFCFYTINYDSKNGTVYEFERVHFNSYWWHIVLYQMCSKIIC